MGSRPALQAAGKCRGRPQGRAVCARAPAGSQTGAAHSTAHAAECSMLRSTRSARSVLSVLSVAHPGLWPPPAPARACPWPPETWRCCCAGPALPGRVVREEGGRAQAHEGANGAGAGGPRRGRRSSSTARLQHAAPPVLPACLGDGFQHVGCRLHVAAQDERFVLHNRQQQGVGHHLRKGGGRAGDGTAARLQPARQRQRAAAPCGGAIARGGALSWVWRGAMSAQLARWTERRQRRRRQQQRRREQQEQRWQSSRRPPPLPPTENSLSMR